MTIFSQTRRGLGIAIALAAVIRAGVFIFTLLQPIPNESGMPISPLNVSPGIDFAFYDMTRDLLFNGSMSDIVESIGRAFDPDLDPSAPGIVYPAAPVFPLILGVFSYGPGNTLPLAIFYFVLGFGLSAGWLWWLHRKGVPSVWLVAFALLPNPIWLTLNVSTDLLFAALVGLFYWAYFRGQSARIWLALGVAVIAALTRPNGVILLIFIVAALFLGTTDLPKRIRLQVIALAAIPIPLLILFFLPELKSFTGEPARYFGATQSEYLAGVFNTLPIFADRALSFLSLVGAKLLYFSGLRPSYGDTDPFLVLIRAAPGLIFLPGLIYMLIWGGREHRLLLVIYLAPVMIGASQDRYNFPIQPLLFYFGYLAYARVGGILGGPFRGRQLKAP